MTYGVKVKYRAGGTHYYTAHSPAEASALVNECLRGWPAESIKVVAIEDGTLE